MQQYSTLYAAADFAATLCVGWSFVTSNEKYDRSRLLAIAEIHDDENPSDEGSFYVVSPNGAIGFCEDGEDIDWLFLTGSSEDEDLPATYSADTQIKFCSKCGNSVIPSTRFCAQCGMALQNKGNAI